MGNTAAPVLGVAVPIIGGVVILVALVALMVWYRSSRTRGDTPPELTDQAPPPPPERDDTWDPRERYEDGPGTG
ncbi:MAG TPA: SKG-like transmembrane protein [Egibacteraceae bacterium]|nr:SKG-like transmembrane protein [Egibacteraceae bacterium]